MNDLLTWEQFIRLVLHALSNNSTLQVHGFTEQVTNIAKESYRGAAFYVKNVTSHINLIDEGYIA